MDAYLQEDPVEFVEKRQGMKRKAKHAMQALKAGIVEEDAPQSGLVENEKQQRKKAYEVLIGFNQNAQEMTGHDIGW